MRQEGLSFADLGLNLKEPEETNLIKKCSLLN